VSCFSHPALQVFVAAGLVLGHQSTRGILQKTLPDSQNGTSYKYDVPGVRLRGRLIQRKVYGPPGYGETPARDARVSILILKLSQQISVKPPEDAEANGSVDLDAAEGVREVQLFIDPPQKTDAYKLVGHEVTAIGTLNESITASQYTKIWMDVKTFDLK
jgi:hypothetical protein